MCQVSSVEDISTHHQMGERLRQLQVMKQSTHSREWLWITLHTTWQKFGKANAYNNIETVARVRGIQIFQALSNLLEDKALDTGFVLTEVELRGEREKIKLNITVRPKVQRGTAYTIIHPLMTKIKTFILRQKRVSKSYKCWNL